MEEKYKSIPEHDWGVTEESYQLLEVNAKEILGDKENEKSNNIPS